MADVFMQIICTCLSSLHRQAVAEIGFGVIAGALQGLHAHVPILPSVDVTIDMATLESGSTVRDDLYTIRCKLPRAEAEKIVNYIQNSLRGSAEVVACQKESIRRLPKSDRQFGSLLFSRFRSYGAGDLGS